MSVRYVCFDLAKVIKKAVATQLLLQGEYYVYDLRAYTRTKAQMIPEVICKPTTGRGEDYMSSLSV